jgi:hypothetical protein
MNVQRRKRQSKNSLPLKKYFSIYFAGGIGSYVT